MTPMKGVVYFEKERYGKDPEPDMWKYVEEKDRKAFKRMKIKPPPGYTEEEWKEELEED